MCLGVPGRVVERHDEQGVAMGTVDFGGVTKTVCLAYAPEAEPGDHVLVHAGFAIAVLDEHEAQASLALFAELGMVEPGGQR